MLRLAVLDDAKVAVATACRQLAAAGLVLGTAGNVSVRHEDVLVVTASGARFAQMSPDDVTVTDLDGTVIDGGLAPTSEIDLHVGIHRTGAAGVNGAVVHTHSPMATAVACVVDELPCIHYQMLLFGGGVRVAAYETFGSPELAANVLAALDGKRAALMSNHGAVTYGSSLDEAVDLTHLLEWACGLYKDAVAIGSPRVLSEQDQRVVVETALRRSYGRPQRVAQTEGELGHVSP